MRSGPAVSSCSVPCSFRGWAWPCRSQSTSPPSVKPRRSTAATTRHWYVYSCTVAMTTPTRWCLTTRRTTRSITRSAPALTPLDAAALTDGLQYALAPQLIGLKSLFDAGRLAIQLNVGPLIQPTTLAQYKSSDKVANPLPPKIFSHNDQTSIWQSDGSEGSTNGWG